MITVDRGTGEILVRNATAAAVDLKSVPDQSRPAARSIRPAAAWNSLTDQGLPGWIESSPTAAHLGRDECQRARSTCREQQSLDRARPTSQSTRRSARPARKTCSFNTTTPARPVTGVVEYTGLDVTNNLVLTVDPTTGYARLRNASPFKFPSTATRSIHSTACCCASNGNWKSLTDQGVSGWVEAAPDCEQPVRAQSASARCSS